MVCVKYFIKDNLTIHERGELLRDTVVSNKCIYFLLIQTKSLSEASRLKFSSS